MGYLSHPDTRQTVDRHLTCLIPSTPLCRSGFESTHKEKYLNYHTALQVSIEKMLWYLCFFLLLLFFSEIGNTADLPILNSMLEISKVIRHYLRHLLRHLTQGTGLKNGKSTGSSHHLSGTVLLRNGNTGPKHRNNSSLLSFISKALSKNDK